MPGISKVERSTTPSTKSSKTEKHGGFGFVKLGDVSSLATWKANESRMEITFNTADFSAERLRDLEHYRSTSRPVEVHLPGEQQTVSCVVVGFELNLDTAFFYLKKARNR